MLPTLDPSSVINQAGSGRRREMPAIFEEGYRELKFESEKQGRLICEPAVKITIIHLGSNDTTERFMRESDKELYPLQWEAFCKKGAAPIVGTPIEAWVGSGLSKARIAELHSCNVLTLETLAEFPDGELGKLGMGGRELQVRARTFLQAQEDAAPLEALAMENATLKADLVDLRNTVAELTKEKKKRPRGRPKKEKTNEVSTED